MCYEKPIKKERERNSIIKMTLTKECLIMASK
jgi:hypothetical protein